MTEAPDWAAVSQLYDQLRHIEERAPGSSDARDVEAAIDAVLDGRLVGSHPRFRTRDAVRRARFLRSQADAKRVAAAARARRPDVTVGSAESSDEDALAAEPVDISDPADLACARDTVRRLLTATGHAPQAHHMSGVLLGLLAGHSQREIADRLFVSRSTVDRCVATLRTESRRLLGNAAAT